MRALVLLPLLGLGTVLVGGVPAHAGGVPALVVPTRPDVPVIINGIDASWCVVDGDWGLERPSIGTTVTCREPVRPLPPQAEPYFPMTGEQPRVGRLEAPSAANQKPRPAESFYRVWTTPPDDTPATVYAPYSAPPVVVAPQITLPANPAKK